MCNDEKKLFPLKNFLLKMILCIGILPVLTTMSKTFASIPVCLVAQCPPMEIAEKCFHKYNFSSKLSHRHIDYTFDNLAEWTFLPETKNFLPKITKNWKKSSFRKKIFKWFLRTRRMQFRQTCWKDFCQTPQFFRSMSQITWKLWVFWLKSFSSNDHSLKV